MLKQAKSFFYTAIKMETVLICIFTGIIIALVLFGLWWTFLKTDETFPTSVDNHADLLDKFAGDLNSLNDNSKVATQRKSVETKPPGEMDPVFFPPPAIDPRVQSVQYEHLQNPDENLNLDYQRKYDFPLMNPTKNSVESYLITTKKQVAAMQKLMHSKFDSAAEKAGISQTSFDSSMFNKDPQMVWTTALIRPDILHAYLAKLCDDIFESLSELFFSRNVVISASGANTVFKTPSINPLSQIEFTNKANRYLDGDELVTGAIRSNGNGLADLSQKQLRDSAKKYVISTYQKLLDKFKFELNDVPRDVYQDREEEVLTTGIEMVDDLFSNTVTVEAFDDFTGEVKDSMQETVFEILLDAGIDPSQFY